MLFLCFLTIASALTYYIVSYYRWVAKYPRGPTPLPFIGNLYQLHPSTLFKSYEKFTDIYGKVFTVFTPAPTVVITDYDLIKEAFVTKGEHFSNRPDHEFPKLFTYCENGGVISSNGQNWREQRRISLTILRDFGMGRNLMEEKIKNSIMDYLCHLKKLKNTDAIDVRWPVQLMIANIICETIFGHRYSYDDCDELVTYVESVTKMFADFAENKMVLLLTAFPWVKHVPMLNYFAYTKHKNNVRKMNKFIERQVEKTLSNYDPTLPPTCFVHAYKQKMLTNEFLTEDQLRACCWDFFLAGQEATTNATRWAFLHLAKNPVVQERMRAEIRSVVGIDRLPSMSDKLRLPYTSAAILELLRVSNIVSTNLPHSTTTETEIGGMTIPAGACIDGDLNYVLAHDPIFKDPKELRPERFLNEDGKTLNKAVVDRCIPFSIGRRQCAGESLARMELFLVVSATVQHFRVLPPLGRPLCLEAIHSLMHSPKSSVVRLAPVDRTNDI